MAYSKRRVSFYARTERFADQSQFMSDLVASLGESKPLKTVSHSLALSKVPVSRLPFSELIDRRPETRLRFSSSDTMLDWVNISAGNFDAYPDGVSFPSSDEELSEIFALSKKHGFLIKAYLKDSSLHDHSMLKDSDKPVLIVSLSRLNRLVSLNPDKKIAVFQAGAVGTDVDAALIKKNFYFDHMYGSFGDSPLQHRMLMSLMSNRDSQGESHLNSIAHANHASMGGACINKIWPAQANGFIGAKARGGLTTHTILRVQELPEKPLTLGFLFYHWQHALAVYRNLLKQKMPLISVNVMNALATRLQIDMTDHELNQELLINELESALPNKPSLLWVTVDASKISMRFYMVKMLDIVKACDVRYHCAFTRQKFYFGRSKQLYLRQKLWRLGYAVDSVEATLPSEHLSATLHLVYHSIRSELGERVELMFQSKRVSESLSQLLVTYIVPVLDSADETSHLLKRLRAILDKLNLQ